MLKEKKRKMNNILTPNPKDRDTNYRQFLKTRTQNDKEHVLKSSIYYNLIAKHNNEKNKTKKEKEEKLKEEKAKKEKERKEKEEKLKEEKAKKEKERKEKEEKLKR